jgi:hypothetical protein
MFVSVPELILPSGSGLQVQIEKSKFEDVLKTGVHLEGSALVVNMNRIQFEGGASGVYAYSEYSTNRGITIRSSHIRHAGIGIYVTNWVAADFNDLMIQSPHSAALIIEGDDTQLIMTDITIHCSTSTSQGARVAVKEWRGSSIYVWGCLVGLDMEPAYNTSWELHDVTAFDNNIGVRCRGMASFSVSSSNDDGIVYFNREKDYDVHECSFQLSNEPIFEYRVWLSRSLIAGALLTTMLSMMSKHGIRMRPCTCALWVAVLMVWLLIAVQVILLVWYCRNLDRWPGSASSLCWQIVAAVICPIAAPCPQYFLEQVIARRTICLVNNLENALWQGDTVAKESAKQNLRWHLWWSAASIDLQVSRLLKKQSEEAGVSASYLLSEEFLDLAQQRTNKADPSFSDMSRPFWFGPDGFGIDVICPRDNKAGCALVDVLPLRHRQKCTHFLSWCWGYKISQVRSALELWISGSNLDEGSIFLYMCFFVNNQYRIMVEASKNGSDNLETVFVSNMRTLTN